MEYSQANGVWQAKAMGLRSFDEDRKQASTRQGGPEARDSCKRSQPQQLPRESQDAPPSCSEFVLPTSFLWGKVSWILLQLVKALPFTLGVSR